MTDNLTGLPTIPVENILSSMTLIDILSFRQTNKSAANHVNSYLIKLFKKSPFVSWYRRFHLSFGSFASETIVDHRGEVPNPNYISEIVSLLRLLETMHPLNESGTISLEKVVNYFTTLFPNEVRFCPRSVEITLTPGSGLWNNRNTYEYVEMIIGTYEFIDCLFERDGPELLEEMDPFYQSFLRDMFIEKDRAFYEAHTDEIMGSHDHYSDNSYNFDRPGRVDYYIVEEKYKDSVLAETMNKGWWRIAFTKEACYRNYED